MFKFFKKSPPPGETPTDEPVVVQDTADQPVHPEEPQAPEENQGSAADDEAPAAEPSPAGFFGRLRQGLSRTRANLADGLSALVSGRKTIDTDLLDDIETQLLLADVGIDATEQVISASPSCSCLRPLIFLSRCTPGHLPVWLAPMGLAKPRCFQ